MSTDAATLYFQELEFIADAETVHCLVERMKLDGMTSEQALKAAYDHVRARAARVIASRRAASKAGG